MTRQRRHLLLLPALSLLLAVVACACASIGRPEGGPRDEMPPVFISANPAPGSLNVNASRLTMVFDENIQLDDPFNKVIVSPVQTTAPIVTSNGRRINIELRDTLLPSTTYTIDFGDAIKDLNEGNLLDGFALDFSTGDTIDSLRVSGIVLEARNLEPAQGMLVGVHSNLSDTAIHTLPFDRVARTNQLGQFTIRNMKPGRYRIFALNDVNRDNHWDRSEDVAFYDYTVSPSVESIEVTDTLKSSDPLGSDSLVTRKGVRYLPNDILLTWFNEGYNPQYLKDYGRPERNRITIQMATEADSLPRLTIIDGDMAGYDDLRWAKLNASPTADTLEYWISDPRVLATDSLRLAVRYQKTDTLDRIVWTTDTLRFFFRDPQKQKKKKNDNDTLPEMHFLDVKPAIQSNMDVYRPLVLTFSQPVATFDTTAVHLEHLIDTVWTAMPVPVFKPDSMRPLLRSYASIKWQPGDKYRISIDSAAVTSIYGEHNKPVNTQFTVRTLEDYAKLILNITGPDSIPAVVELMMSDNPLRTMPVTDGRAVFEYLNAGTYYVRLFLDSNGNGKWDTGNLKAKIQPEEIYYFNKKFELKRNWDVEQSWNIYEMPLDLQKPRAILKNKPKRRAGEKYDDEEEKEDDDEGIYGNDSRFGEPAGSGIRPINRPSGLRQNTGR